MWDVRGPQFVREDWRPGERFRATINLPESKWNTLEKMLLNVGLFTPFAAECEAWFNERLDDQSTDEWNRKTTRGEIVRFWGAEVASALNPSVPVNQAWRSAETARGPVSAA